MDSNSDSSDLMLPKLEIDSENESPRREPRLMWSSENTMKLIKMLETECKELWDVKNPWNKDRSARQAKLEYLADQFGTTSEEISRKIHNLRTQMNNELRKIKRRQASAGCGDSGAGVSGWEYFDALSFLIRAPTVGGDSLTFPASDPLDSIEGVHINFELAEFQANEEEEFGVAKAAPILPKPTTPTPNARRNKSGLRVAACASAPPPPVPPNPLMWPPEDVVPRIRPGANADECQIFGDFVASELRTLRSVESRKKLKRMIQKAILQIGEEEDVNIINCKYSEVP